MELVSVGVVHSSVRSGHEMPVQGVTAEVEIYPPYADALRGIGESSHLILLCWMHEADRAVLTAVARKVAHDLPEKGVFSLRSPPRPNPISLSVVRLLGIREERFLKLECLDLIDGTPVLDIKPYQTGWDCVFAATGHDRTEKIQKMGVEAYRVGLVREAVNYHGSLCPGAAVGVRVAEAATRLFGGDLRNSAISVMPGSDPCIADALIGITGARPGNRRLLAAQEGCLFRKGRREVHFLLRAGIPRTPEEILACDEAELFAVDERDREEEGAPVDPCIRDP
ncbi:tRNA (N6-threonylcarbamoyladenosine(37)-N6)-methyltransferase TrmO [Methanoculleus sp. FWC-SCC1]|uniref:tRNA (N6-threonylcarbamoyladenosine(37)-N6)-methyltransferase TrmO n=2 Tax=Methanoculleus frigidifontis TaxID=2584085 RepID=A0ABT8M996_9EURY|nr:tRNA (N6-threonylcarbamoyladenosine(37)-N6)-methyltransferase TrmO [Methanoculleus sp. FWC-SCC1]